MTAHPEGLAVHTRYGGLPPKDDVHNSIRGHPSHISASLIEVAPLHRPPGLQKQVRLPTKMNSRQFLPCFQYCIRAITGWIINCSVYLDQTPLFTRVWGCQNEQRFHVGLA